MKTKVYGIRGYIEKVAELHVGKAILPVHFKGGNINATLSTPAQYRTSNPVEQMMIENCNEFKKGLIFIADIFDDGKPDTTQVISKAAPVETVQEPAQEKTTSASADTATETTANAEVQKFSTLADAKDYLKTKGITVDGIRLKPDAIEIAKANGLNIEFTR